MANIKIFKLLGVMLAVMLIIWGIAPILTGQELTNDVLANAIILAMIGIAYFIIMFKPPWTKAVFFFEGIVIGACGFMLFDNPYNIGFAVIGLIIVIIAILAYLQKLPAPILKFFYK